MSNKTVILLLTGTAFFLTFSSMGSQPVKEKAESVFSGDIIAKIQFKIMYAWQKSREYFRLAMAAPGDAAQKQKQDIDARIDVKKDDFSRKVSDTCNDLYKNVVSEANKGKEKAKAVFSQKISDLNLKRNNINTPMPVWKKNSTSAQTTQSEIQDEDAELRDLMGLGTKSGKKK